MSEGFKQALERMVQEYGLDSPKRHGNERMRAAYRQFLSRRFLTEDDVAPILAHKDITPEMYAATFHAFIQASKSRDKQQLSAVLELVSSIVLQKNTNDLIEDLTYRLLRDLESVHHHVPEFYAGVFPTGCINGQCALEDDIPLVLINTGCMEMIEAAVTTFVSKRNETEQALLLIKIFEDFYFRGETPDSRIADHPSIDWGAMVVPRLVTAVEEFVLVHEIAHIALGHLSDGSQYSLPQRAGGDLVVLNIDHAKEHEADVWALCRLVERARRQKDAELALDLSCSGALMFLYMGLMMEAMAESRSVEVQRTHPRAETRIYFAELTLEVLDAHAHNSIARKFGKLVRELCVLEEVEERSPPLLDRELNRRAAKTYDKLSIPYKHLPFIAEFQ